MAAALSLATGALNQLEDPDDVRRMYPLRVAGMVALYVGRLDDGYREHAEMLRLARLHDRPYEAGMALLGLAQSRTYAGEPDRGLFYADEQLRVVQPLGNPSMLALAWYDRAEALSSIDAVRAIEPYQRAIQLAESAGSTFVEGIALVGLASLLGSSSEPGVALPLFRSIISRWRRMGIWHHQWTTLRNLVQLFVRTENWETATDPPRSDRRPEHRHRRRSAMTPTSWTRPRGGWRRSSEPLAGTPPELLGAANVPRRKRSPSPAKPSTKRGHRCWHPRIVARVDKQSGGHEAVAMLGRRGLGGLLSFFVLAVALALLAPTSAPPTAAAPAAAGRAGRARGAVALRPRPQGLSGHGP